MATERPPHTVERSDGPIEVRTYPARIVAQITVEGDRRQAASRAFGPLANYIFARERGGDDGPRIAMTAPVTQSPEDAGRWTVQFIMPARWTIKTLPKPGRQDIRLETLPQQRFAVIGFSGRPTDSSVQEHEARLRAWMKGEGLQPAGVPVYAYYDPPFKPGFLRHNEVMIPVD